MLTDFFRDNHERIAFAYFKDPAKTAMLFVAAAVIAGAVLALTLLPVDDSNTLVTAFVTLFGSFITGGATRKRAYSPDTVHNERETAYQAGVQDGARL